MFTQALLPDTLRAIRVVSPLPALQKAYLAGGTALALQIGHRVSVDLDFFTAEQFSELVVAENLKKFKGFSLERAAPLTVLGKIGETRISLFTYPYAVIERFIKYESINLLGKKDLAAMKIHALEDRGTKRDFIDVYFLARELPLEEMFACYEQKYRCLKDHLFNIIKSLNYFADAEPEAEPKMLVPIRWEEVKSFFNQEAIRLAQKFVFD